MMRPNKYRHSGFSLIELVATLLLAGVIAGGGTSLVVYVAQGYNTVRQQAGLAQAAELAMGRLIREARHADGIAGGGTSVTFSRDGSVRQFALTGSTLGIQVGGVTYPLMRNVSAFAVQRTASGDTELISFTITPAGSNPVFTTGHLVVPTDG